MSRELTPTLLGDVARRTLEEAAFLFSDEAPSGLALEAPVIEGTLPFVGTVRGTLALRMPEALAVEAAANLLGTEPDDADAKENAAAAVGELLNMLSGRLMPLWFGGETQCSLGTPTVVTHDEWTGPGSPATVTAAFLAGEGALVEVAARVDAPGASSGADAGAGGAPRP